MYTLKLNNNRWEIFPVGQEQYKPVFTFRGNRALAEEVLAYLNVGESIPAKLLSRIAKEKK